MCRAMEDMRNQTLKEGMKEVAIRMLAAGKYALEEIANISGLSIDEISELKIDYKNDDYTLLSPYLILSVCLCIQSLP